MPKQLSWVALLLAAVLPSAGCSALNDFGAFRFSGQDDGGTDSGTPDAGVDAGVDAGLDAGLDAGQDGGLDGGSDGGTDGGATPRGPTAVVQTAGGAVITTPEYRLRVAVGAPQPMGARSNGTQRVRLGPVPR